MKRYSLKQSIDTFIFYCKIYKKKKETLSAEEQLELENLLLNLQSAISSKDKKQASIEAKRLEKKFHEKISFRESKKNISKYLFTISSPSICYCD